MSDDLKHDLEQVASSDLDLASQQKSAAFPLTEIASKSAPAPSRTLKKASGPKAVASKRPTVKAAPEPTAAAQTVDQPQTQVAVQTPIPTTVDQAPDPSAPAVPRPSPIPVDPNAGTGASRGNGGGTSAGAGDGGGSILGGIFGVIIRGGVVDGDHCDPRTDGRRGRGPVYGAPLPGRGYPATPGQIPSRVGGGIRF